MYIGKLKKWLAASVIFLTGILYSIDNNAQGTGSVVLSTSGATISQNFDNNLAASGTGTILPLGWYFSESGTNANASYTPSNGASNIGDTYSFGSAGVNPVTDRAFGTVSGTVIPTIGARFLNNIGAAISLISITYSGEQWRCGQSNRGTALDNLAFEYSTNATSLTTGTWIPVTSLNFSGSSYSSTGSKDGNAPANRTASISASFGINVPHNVSFWIRWVDYDFTNTTTNEDGLAIDDFFLTAETSTGGSSDIPTLDMVTATGNTTSNPVAVGQLNVTNKKLSTESVEKLAAMNLISSGPSGADYRWGTFTASAGGFSGVNPNAYEIWEYPSVSTSPTCCRPRLQMLNSESLTVAGDVRSLIVGPKGNLSIGSSNTTTALNSSAMLDVNGNLSATGIATIGNYPTSTLIDNNPNGKLFVNGDIVTSKLKVSPTGWSDYVFDSDYQLPPLTSVEGFIKAHKHLPDVPSAAEVSSKGLDVGDNQAILLKKIEELTLYIISLEKRLNAMTGIK